MASPALTSAREYLKQAIVNYDYEGWNLPHVAIDHPGHADRLNGIRDAKGQIAYYEALDRGRDREAAKAARTKIKEKSDAVIRAEVLARTGSDSDLSAFEQVFVPDDQEPADLLELPDWPGDELRFFPFFRPVDSNGSPLSWMRAGSKIDGKSGVYLIFDMEGDAVYVGSSTGTSAQGNIRRTMARHWQDWERRTAYGKRSETAGVVLPRRDVAVCVIPVVNDAHVPDAVQMLTSKGKPPVGDYALAPRQIESWYQREVAKRYRLLGLARLVEFDYPDTPF